MNCSSCVSNGKVPVDSVMKPVVLFYAIQNKCALNKHSSVDLNWWVCSQMLKGHGQLPKIIYIFWMLKVFFF